MIAHLVLLIIFVKTVFAKCLLIVMMKSND